MMKTIICAYIDPEDLEELNKIAEKLKISKSSLLKILLTKALEEEK